MAKALNVVITTWLLAAKLIAWESQELNVVAVLRLELLVQHLETFVLGREAALAGRVDDEDDLVGVVCEGDGLTFLCSACVSGLCVQSGRWSWVDMSGDWQFGRIGR